MYPTDRAMTWIHTSEQPLWLILYYIIYYYLVYDFCNRCVIIYSSLPEYLAPYQHPPLPLAPGGGGPPSSLLKRVKFSCFLARGDPPPPIDPPLVPVIPYVQTFACYYKKYHDCAFNKIHY